MYAMKSLCWLFVFVLMPLYSAGADDLSDAVQNVRNQCGAISSRFEKMKKMAGINTAITGVGTGVGVGAVAVGFAKSAKDRELADLEQEINELKRL